MKRERHVDSEKSYELDKGDVILEIEAGNEKIQGIMADINLH